MITTESLSKIEFIDLQSQRHALGSSLNQAVERVLEHGAYILGPEVQKLEEELCTYTQAKDAITCSNGTDALRLLLLAYNVGPQDAVLVPTFTFASTAEVVAEAKATPIFVDVCPKTYNIDVNSLEEALATAKRLKLHPKGIIAVDLFGLPANYPAISQFADQNELWIIADACQSFGGEINGAKVGTLATTTAISFFPSKPLACYGDGGAIFTTDEKLGRLIRSLRNHGCGTHRYDYQHIGLNSRLDTLQAAILLEKLKLFPQERQRRQAIAHFYNQALKGWVEVPEVPENILHAWGLYTVLCSASERDAIANALQEAGIPTNVYYRKPLHLQPAYEHFPRATAHLHHAEVLTQRVLSLPMHPYLSDEQLEYVVAQLKNILA